MVGNELFQILASFLDLNQAWIYFQSDGLESYYTNFI